MEIEIISKMILTGVIGYFTGYFFGFFLSGKYKEFKKKHPKCLHKNKHTYIDWVATSCEKTTITCLDCNKKFKSKVEC